VSKSDIADLTKRANIIKRLESLKNSVYKECSKINSYLFNFEGNWIRGMLEGDYSVTSMSKEMVSLLDSNELFYRNYGNYAEVIFEKILENEFKFLSSYIVKYFDKSLGVVYVAKNVDLVNKYIK
jgi:hypothetical protein